MLNQLIEIAWKSAYLNQIFSLLLIMILFLQIIRHISFRLAVSHWAVVFESYHREFRDQKNARYELDKQEELIPPQYNQPIWHILPSILTMLGLLGTFIGLTLALAVIPFGGETDEILDGVKRALPMMGSAFWTSLSALFASLSIKINQYLLSQIFKQKVLRRLSKLDDPKILNQLEQLAFSKGLNGAFLRDYQLKDVIWHQNLNHQRQLERLGLHISEAIKTQSQRIDALLDSRAPTGQNDDMEFKDLMKNLLKSQIEINQKISDLLLIQEKQQQKKDI